MSDDRFRGRVALVTGASSGIGRAVALAYARLGGAVYLCGRSQERLDDVAREARTLSAQATVCRTDLTQADEPRRLADLVRADARRLDLLVHAAGDYVSGPVKDVSSTDLDALYAANVRAPYALTRELLSLLGESRGQIVFINSTVVYGSTPGVAAYAMTKHALRAFADHLRAEVNDEGIRVLSIYPGRTATPMQERIFHSEGKAYVPDRLLQPEDVAAVVVDAVSASEGAEVVDIRIRSRIKA